MIAGDARHIMLRCSLTISRLRRSDDGPELRSNRSFDLGRPVPSVRRGTGVNEADLGSCAAVELPPWLVEYALTRLADVALDGELS
jgi:hypothetical protein